jgi:hypothetical protein
MPIVESPSRKNIDTEVGERQALDAMHHWKRFYAFIYYILHTLLK